MKSENKYLSRKPFDLYEMQLVRLVATCGGFTRAAQKVGLTQSAVTRQIQGVEERLGVELFERTTRRLALTAAGEFFLEEARRISGDIESLTHRMMSTWSDAPPLVRIGLARSISMAYYPGFLVASRRRQPGLVTHISQDLSRTLLGQLEEGNLDVAVVTTPHRLSDRLRIVHQFEDGFVFISSDAFPPPTGTTKSAVYKWAHGLPWILLHEETETGRRMRQWMKQRGLPIKAFMQVDNFDLIVNLVALGQGASLVPHRALAIYARKRGLCRIQTGERFSRKLAVVVRRHRTLAEPVKAFVENILF